MVLFLLLASATWQLPNPCRYVHVMGLDDEMIQQQTWFCALRRGEELHTVDPAYSTQMADITVAALLGSLTPFLQWKAISNIEKSTIYNSQFRNNDNANLSIGLWIPAYAGMTDRERIYHPT